MMNSATPATLQVVEACETAWPGYRLLAPLDGQRGTVWRAKELATGQSVLMKLAPAPEDTVRQTSLRREAAWLAEQAAGGWPAPRLRRLIERPVAGGLALALVVDDPKGEAARLARRTGELEAECRTLRESNRAAAAEIDHLQQLARDAARAKTEFLANMSHEFRTPMNAILGMSHLALRSGLDPRQRNYVQKVHSSAAMLLGILNDILDFSRIEAGKLQIEPRPFQLADILDNLTGLVGLEAEGRGLELIYRLPPALPQRLVGDPLRLAQVLSNLCANAIKFTNSGRVTVNIEPRERSGDELALQISVRDTGIGIPPEQQQRLFMPFQQADASNSRLYGGTGVGLALCRRLVDLMGGVLAVESGVGHGSVFRFTLKFGVEAEAAPPPPALAGVRALLLDPEDAAREAVAEMAQGLGIEVQTCGDAWDAMRRASLAAGDSRPFDLALVDAQQQNIGVVACVRQLVLAGVPSIVMMSRSTGSDTLAQSLRHVLPHVPVAMLAKPALPRSLHEACVQALQRPLDGPSAAADDQRVLRMAALRGAHVLLVEDNAINQELALTLLEDAGLRVSLAADGREAVAAVQRGTFDGVLMDCQMPVMDGYEATRTIRALPQGRTLPIIAMTANAMAGDREQALAAGMNDHIAKPIDVGAMFDTLARWVRPARTGDPAA